MTERLYPVLIKQYDGKIEYVKLCDLNETAKKLMDEDFFDFVSKYASKQNNTQRVMDVYAMYDAYANVDYTDYQDGKRHNVHWQIHSLPMTADPETSESETK